MLELLLFNIEQPKHPLIQIATESETVQVEEAPEPTLEEKIATNFYECDESIEWISAEDASCLPKRTQAVYNTTTTQNTPREAYSGSHGTKPGAGWFPYGQCTYWVWSKRHVGQWNNATDWLWQAQRDGYATGSTPRVGAIAWEYGHVSYVEAVNGDMVTISEMNYSGVGVVTRRTLPASSFTYIY